MQSLDIVNPYPLPGEVLDGKYRIERLLGEGAMGAVTEATHLVRRVPVALKFLSPAVLSIPGAAERFVNEGVAASQIESDHVVKIFDVGRMPNGAPYLVMEFLEGWDLGQLIVREGPLIAPARAVHFTLQALQALQIAHAAGILHLDMKPSNFFVISKNGEPDFIKLVDFGIGKVRTIDSQTAQLTQTNSAVGTPLYMSPEQARSPRDVDCRTDLYSAGAILYEMLSGRTPYASESGEYTEILFKIITTDPEPLRQLRGELPDGLAAVVHRALLRDRESRFGSAADMAEALAPFADQRSAPVLRRLRRPRGQRPPAEARPSTAAAGPSPPLDEDVEFTVYRPSVVVPQRWYDLLAFAHRSRRVEGDDPDLDPSQEVERQARAVLGKQSEAYRPLREESSQGVPLESDLTFVLVLPGFEVNPPRRTFRWSESVHREDFRIRAPKSLAGQRVRGHVSVYLGPVLIADVQIGVRVAASPDETDVAVERAAAHKFRKIFASYSHKDATIIDRFVRLARALGDEYLIDCLDLRAGELWSERLRSLIEQADVFQLFWSWNSMNSEFVRAEWEFALSLGRTNFVRPTFWERPMPEQKERDLPPANLACLHFQDIGPALSPQPKGELVSSATAASPSSTAEPSSVASTPARKSRVWLGASVASVAALLTAGSVMLGGLRAPGIAPPLLAPPQAGSSATVSPAPPIDTSKAPPSSAVAATASPDWDVEVWAVWDQRLRRFFPFVPPSPNVVRTARFEDFRDFFRPDGTLWRFFRVQLADSIALTDHGYVAAPGALPSQRGVLSCLSVAREITDAFFPPGQAPGLEFSLRVDWSEAGLREARFAIADQVTDLPRGQWSPPMKWNGEPILLLYTVDGLETKELGRGPFSLYEFLERGSPKAAIGSSTYVMKFGPLTLLARAEGRYDAFAPAFFTRLDCPRLGQTAAPPRSGISFDH